MLKSPHQIFSEPQFLQENPEAIARWGPLLKLEPLDRQVVFQQALSGAFHNTSTRLDQVQKETLVVTGDSDRLIHMKNSHLIAEKIPNSRLVVLPGVGHELPSQAGPQMVQLLQEFCL
ncbi:MAG: alpha/beta hydrolase [Deltaproteobacteria bacterium]|nr:alpha/beta hydrolase [Deltaproteobacteria bacterium]